MRVESVLRECVNEKERDQERICHSYFKRDDINMNFPPNPNYRIRLKDIVIIKQFVRVRGKKENNPPYLIAAKNHPAENLPP